jgi:hypothetical protein
MEAELSETTRRELYSLFHEQPRTAEYWAYLMRVARVDSGLNPERAARLFLQADAEAHEKSQNSAPKSGLRPIKLVDSSDPRVQPASLEEVEAAVGKASYILSRQPNPSHVAMVAEVLMEGRWTKAEIDAAYRVVVSDPAIVERVSYTGAIAPSHFFDARRDARTMMGRLHTESAARKWAKAEAGDDNSKHNRIMGRWFEPVSYAGERMFALTTIADDSHV